jgi:hypothetical protein
MLAIISASLLWSSLFLFQRKQTEKAENMFHLGDRERYIGRNEKGVRRDMRERGGEGQRLTLLIHVGVDRMSAARPRARQNSEIFSRQK